jgi:CheY-like chemotaxis protein/HPt (histidine-containing phosphotransfer) domain-containing protein
MICKEKLLEISELKLAGSQQMDENKLNTYAKSLHLFVEGFPEQEERIKAALEAKDHVSLSKCLADIRDLLEAIHASDMVDECTKHIKDLKNVKYEKLEAFIAYFLTTLSILSIDIQMAELKEDVESLPYVDIPAEAAPESAEKKCILAVDDTPFFLTTLKKIMQDTDNKLICVSFAKDALKFLEKHHPDLFLLDIEMPEMDGYELAVKIREKGEKAPIIFLTGNAKRENVVKAVEAGAADFIVKPVNKEGVLAKIERYI